MGFVDLDRPRHMLGVNEFVLVLGLIFLVLLFIGLATRRIFAPSPLGMSIRSMVPVTIIYAIAMISALYPKAAFGFADIGRDGTRPVTAYGASATVAVVAAFFVSLLFRFVFDPSGNLFQTISTPGAFRAALEVSLQRLPWMFMTFAITFAIAWVTDNRAATPGDVPRWLRYVECGGMSGMFLVAQYVTLELLLSSAPAIIEPSTQFRLLSTAAIVGGLIGALLPHWYRRIRMNMAPRSSGPIAPSPAWHATVRRKQRRRGQGVHIRSPVGRHHAVTTLQFPDAVRRLASSAARYRPFAGSRVQSVNGPRDSGRPQ